MPKPADLPHLATDANYPAGGDPWNGTPTRVEPSSGRLDEGFEPGTRLPAQEFNWLVGLLCDWVDWFDSLNSGSQTKHISALNGLATDSTQDWNQSDLASYGLISQSQLGTRAYALDIPVGSTITEIRARIKDNATAPNYVSLDCLKATDESATVIGSTQTSSGAGAWQTLTQSGLSEVVVAGTNYQALISAVITPAGTCKIAWIEVDYTGPGA